MTERSSEEWVCALRQPGAGRDAALAELHRILVRGLGYALASYADVYPSDLEDFAQDAVLKILAALDSFQGRSRFTTWAQKIAVHVAFTELRRRRWQDVPLQALTNDSDLVPQVLTDPLAGPEEQTIRQQVLDILRQTIAEELTARQRQALVGVHLQGMPLEEVARRMGSNRNALYKLLHDARKRLKRRLVAAGLPPEEILAAFD